MRFEVKTEHKGGTVTDHVFSNWFECRSFLLLLTDNDRILIRDIAESILQIGMYRHHNKWYDLIVKCKTDITIGEALKTIAEYDCISSKNCIMCKDCPLNRDDSPCLSILAKDAIDKISKTVLSEKEADYCEYDCKIVKNIGD